jgi:hypothetical protein
MVGNSQVGVTKLPQLTEIDENKSGAGHSDLPPIIDSVKCTTSTGASVLS